MIYDNAPQEIYYVYILLCNDLSYYVGLTNNLERRIREHVDGYYHNCYTFKRRPLEFVYFETIPFLQEALKREKQLKGWSRAKKRALIERDYHKLRLLAQCQNLSHFRYKDNRKRGSTE